MAYHAYTTLGVLTLSNGVKLVKARNPWGGEKYIGPWSDSDKKWTEKFKKEAKLEVASDGTFYIPIENYLKGFACTIFTPDTSKWHHSYFLSLDNKQLGKAGVSKYCGAKCKRNKFTIESDIT